MRNQPLMDRSNSQVPFNLQTQPANGLAGTKTTHDTGNSSAAQLQHHRWPAYQQYGHTGAGGSTSVPMQLSLRQAVNPYGRTQLLVTKPYEVLDEQAFYLPRAGPARTGLPTLHSELPRADMLHLHSSFKRVEAPAEPFGARFANVLYVSIVPPVTANAYFGGLAL